MVSPEVGAIPTSIYVSACTDDLVPDAGYGYFGDTYYVPTAHVLTKEVYFLY